MTQTKEERARDALRVRIIQAETRFRTNQLLPENIQLMSESGARLRWDGEGLFVDSTPLADVHAKLLLEAVKVLPRLFEQAVSRTTAHVKMEREIAKHLDDFANTTENFFAKEKS